MGMDCVDKGGGGGGGEVAGALHNKILCRFHCSRDKMRRSLSKTQAVTAVISLASSEHSFAYTSTVKGKFYNF